MLCKTQNGKDIRTAEQKRGLSGDLERRMLVRKLHDECGGLLCTLQCKMEALKHDLPPDPSRFREEADQVILLLDRLGENLRGLFNRLNPVTPEQLRLSCQFGVILPGSAVQWPDVKIDCGAAESPRPLPREADLALFGFRRGECEKGAGPAPAKKIEVRMEKEEDWAVLSISENGGAADPAAAAVPGEGKEGQLLPGLREQPVFPGDVFELFSAPGAGLRVRVRIRLPRAGEEGE
jgi:two-component system, NarL family, sensor histidine kinase UhpB